MKARYLAAAAALVLVAACSKPAQETATPSTVAAETPVSVQAPAGVYKNDPNHTSLTWTLNHLGYSNYTARLMGVDATLTLDPVNPANSRIDATIDPLSVATNYPGDYKATHGDSPYASFDEAIGKGEGFLNGAKFPTITFKSTAVEQTGPKTAKVTGDLTFLGVTKPVVLEAAYVGDAAQHPMTKAGVIGFSAVGKFNRSDFGMAKGPLGDEVTIRFDGEFNQQAAAPAAPPAG